MGRGVRENRPHLFDWQLKIRRDFGFVHTSFPILNDVVRRIRVPFRTGRPRWTPGFTSTRGQSDQSIGELPFLLRF